MAINPKDDYRGYKSQPKLTLEEFSKVKEIFIQTFDLYFSSIISEGDVIEISEYLGKSYSSFRLYQIALPQSVVAFNHEIFNSILIRDFHLELLERVSMEITSVGDQIFERLIHTLAEASVACKAVPSDRSDGVDPILMSIQVGYKDVVKVYLENPWFVTLALMNTQFKRTLVGQKS